MRISGVFVRYTSGFADVILIDSTVRGFADVILIDSTVRTNCHSYKYRNCMHQLHYTSVNSKRSDTSTIVQLCISLISMYCALLNPRHIVVARSRSMARSAPLGGAARGISEYCTGDLLYIALHVHQSTAVPAKFLSDQDQPTPLCTSR